MAKRDKDWGNPPTPQEVAEIMNSIDKLRDDLIETEAEYSAVGKELGRRRLLLESSKDELGRMLKAAPRYFENTSFRVIHESEAHGDVMGQLFGRFSVAHD